MYCDRCGKPLPPGGRFCAACGTEITGGAVATAPPGKVQRHLQVLGILWIVYGLFTLLGAFFLLVIGGTMMGAGIRAHMHDVPLFVFPMMNTLGILLFAVAALKVVAGWSLMQRRPWARVLTLVLGFIALLNVPFGTALGIYTIWVLMAGNAGQEYQALADQAKG